MLNKIFTYFHDIIIKGFNASENGRKVMPSYLKVNDEWIEAPNIIIKFLNQ